MSGVTLFVDASHDARSKLAGYGAWAKGDNRASTSFHQPLRTHVRSTNEAELLGIIKAILMLERNGYFVPEDKYLLVQCDNTNALGSLMTLGIQNAPHATSKIHVAVRSHLHPHEKLALQHLEEFMKRTTLDLYVRHIKGHGANANSRSWVNNRTDYLAKQGLSEARQLKASAFFHD